MILKLKNQLIKTSVSAECADERRSIGLDGGLIEDAEQEDRPHSENVRSSSHCAQKRHNKRQLKNPCR
jgi:hypothetical protein